MRTAMFLQRAESSNLFAVITTKRHEMKIIAASAALQILRHNKGQYELMYRPGLGTVWWEL
jgi:hypothetical protein